MSQVRVQLSPEATQRITAFREALRSRGNAEVQLTEIVSSALLSLPDAFWKTRLEEMTPLEFRIREALGQPEIREKLARFIQREVRSP